jgi:hypothetical protein
MAQGSREGGGVKTPKLKSKRERTAEEIRTMMRTDPVFRENFLKALPDSGVVWQIVRALLEASSAPIPPSTRPGNEPPKE